MSKRDKGASLATYMEEDTLGGPGELLCLLGWSPKHHREKMPISEVLEAFDCRKSCAPMPV